MNESKYLSDLEVSQIEIFNQNTVLVNAIRKVLLATIYSNGTLRKDIDPDPARNGALGLALLAIGGKGVVTNADLGEDLRGLAQGISLLENGLNQLSKITSKKAEAPEEKGNPAV